MAKKVSREQMEGIVRDGEARALAEECSYGMGSPIESRIAAAFVEFSDNLKKLVKWLTTLLESVRGLVREAKASRAEARKLLEEQKRTSAEIAAAAEAIGAAVRDMRSAQDEIAEAALVKFDQHLFPYCEGKVKYTIESLMRRSEKISDNLDGMVRKTDEFNKKFGEKAGRTLDRCEKLAHDSNMPASYKFALFAVCVLLVLSTVTCCNATSTFAPIMTGEVAIAYSEGYENSLAETNHELAVARAELEAYKAAFPEGLTEGRQAALEERISELEKTETEQE